MNQQKINILFVLPSLHYTGAETQAINIANGISDKKFQKYMIIFQKQIELLDKLNTEKIAFSKYPRRFKFDAAIIIKISKIIRKNHIDIIHCTNQLSYLFSILGKLLSRKNPKVIVTLHTTKPRNRKNALFDFFLFAPLMLFSDKIITVCRKQNLYWQRKYPYLRTKFVTIHNGIDMHFFRDKYTTDDKNSLRRSLGIKEQEFVCAIIAKFRPEKGHDIALQAVRKLKNKNYPINLILIGDGEHELRLRQLSSSFSLGESVKWTGYQKDPKPYMAISDFVILPSVAVETFSLTILQALAMNTPVIATDIGGAAESVIDGYNGYLIKPNDPDSLAHKLIEMMKDHRLLDKMSKNTRDSVNPQFDVSAMVRKTEVLLESMVPTAHE